LKQTVFKIVDICFSVTAHVAIRSLQNNIKRYNFYQEIHICDLFFCNSVLLLDHYKITLKDTVFTKKYISAICFLFLFSLIWYRVCCVRNLHMIHISTYLRDFVEFIIVYYMLALYILFLNTGYCEINIITCLGDRIG